MKIRILDGDEARSRLACEEFQRSWRSLCDACAWSTGYQSPEFAIAWYETYAAIAQPLVVFTEAGDSKELVGLLALAVEAASDRIFNVGDHQSEYHSWIARTELADEFIVAAVIALRERFPGGSLLFRYLPPNAPTAWFNAAGELSSLVSTREVSRPLIRLVDDQQIERTLHKKGNKSRLNRLRKEAGGGLTFAIATELELRAIIDEVARYYDLRQGAVNGVSPFKDDVFKKEFYLRLMSAGILHALVLRAGSSLAAAILSVKSGDCLSIGVLAYSVYLARHSPGKFGVLFLSRVALQDGYHLIDLTPGGQWKERFANDSDSVIETKVWFDKRAAARAVRGAKALMLLKRSLALFGVTPQAVRNAAATFRRATTAAIARRLKGWAWDYREFRVYYFDAKRAASLLPETVMRRDNIDDLLSFEATSPWLSRTDFLGRALQQMENGSHVYTAAADGRLDHYGWLTERVRKSHFSEVDAEFVYPPNSAVLFDYYTHPAARGRGLYQRAVLQMLKDAASIPGTERVYISVLADNRPSRHVIEKLGFNYECSLLRRSRFGRVMHTREETSHSVRALQDAGPCARVTAG
jgi:RimJ/RimL family protein N-acetyltransferase/CelD/BcsL family acetyltransferase involved in cellulose biosynthesis